MSLSHWPSFSYQPSFCAHVFLPRDGSESEQMVAHLECIVLIWSKYQGPSPLVHTRCGPLRNRSAASSLAATSVKAENMACKIRVVSLEALCESVILFASKTKLGPCETPSIQWFQSGQLSLPLNKSKGSAPWKPWPPKKREKGWKGEKRAWNGIKNIQDASKCRMACACTSFQSCKDASSK